MTPAGAGPADWEASDPPRRTAVLHFGLGAFHRGHQAHFFDRLLTLGHRDWGIASVNLRSRGIVDALSAQGNVYHRWERGPETDHIRRIRSITLSCHLPSQRDDVMALFRSRDVQMITVTVSEKGYLHDPVGA